VHIAFYLVFLHFYLVFCAPYWTHLKEYWEIRHEPNVIFLKYEDMKQDIVPTIKRVADFLGKRLTNAEIYELKDHLSFENMKKNDAVNKEAFTKYMKELHGTDHNTKFMRKGQVGSWKEEISSKANAKLDEWIQANGIKGLYN